VSATPRIQEDETVRLFNICAAFPTIGLQGFRDLSHGIGRFERRLNLDTQSTMAMLSPRWPIAAHIESLP
jgi:hypothetical protein